MSNSNSEFEALIKQITEDRGVSEQDIAKAVKRNPGYIAQLRSRRKKGEEIPQKFIDLLKLHYAIDEQNGIRGTLQNAKPKKSDEIAVLKIRVEVLTEELAKLWKEVTKSDSDLDFYKAIKKKMQARLTEPPDDP